MRKVFGVMALATAALILCECDGKPRQSIPISNKPHTYKAPDDKMAFDVHLDLTAAAIKRLKSEDGGVAVAVSYYGLPTPVSMPRANQIHEIELGDERVGVGPDTKVVHLTGALDRSQLPEVVDGAAYMMVTGYSTSPVGAAREVIVCNSYRESIQQAQVPGTAVIHCDEAPPEVDNSSKYVP